MSTTLLPATDARGKSVIRNSPAATKPAKPIVRSVFGIHGEHDREDGLPRVDGAFEVDWKVGGVEVHASVDLRRSCGERPVLYLAGGEGDDCFELAAAPGDAQSLADLIALLTALRDAVVRDVPDMLAKEREFNSFVARFAVPKRLPAKKAKRAP